ncbi:MAG: hypothetical protein ACR2NN_17595 [Bryobacteraceae bacterium]
MFRIQLLMTITHPIRLTPQEESEPIAQARARGVSVDELLQKTVLQIIAAAPEVKHEPMSAEQWEKEFEEWLDSLPDLRTLSDEAISRESIYTREDEWR